MSPQPVKIANRMFGRFVGATVYDIEDFREFELTPQEPNDSGVLRPQLWLSFKNTRSRLYAINVSRKMDGSYVFGYEIYRGSGSNSCYPSERWKHNHPKAETLQKCLINAMRYMTKFQWYHGVIDQEVKEAAEVALRIIKRKEIRQMTIFDLPGV